MMSKHKPTVLVLMGGPDAERPVSLMSGAEVTRALRELDHYHVVDLTIDQPRRKELQSLIAEHQAHVVFPVLHGPWGEGGPLQTLLEMIEIPFVGSPSEAAWGAMDKIETKYLADELDITIPSSWIIPDDEGLHNPKDLEPPLVIKPIDDGSSVDLRICHTSEEIEAACSELLQRREKVLAERYVPGREITVGILLDKALPVTEIIPAEDAVFYDYAAKYERDDTRYVVEPDLPAHDAVKCREWSLKMFQALGCRDIARVDFICNEKGPWFLEINTMPGFTTHSLVPMAAKHIGISFPELCGQLVEAALARR